MLYQKAKHTRSHKMVQNKSLSPKSMTPMKLAQMKIQTPAANFSIHAHTARQGIITVMSRAEACNPLPAVVRDPVCPDQLTSSLDSWPNRNETHR